MVSLAELQARNRLLSVYGRSAYAARRPFSPQAPAGASAARFSPASLRAAVQQASQSATRQNESIPGKLTSAAVSAGVQTLRDYGRMFSRGFTPMRLLSAPGYIVLSSLPMVPEGFTRRFVRNFDPAIIFPGEESVLSRSMLLRLASTAFSRGAIPSVVPSRFEHAQLNPPISARKLPAAAVVVERLQAAGMWASARGAAARDSVKHWGRNVSALSHYKSRAVRNNSIRPPSWLSSLRQRRLPINFAGART